MSAIRTPPSLKWLLNRRAKLSGEIEKLKKIHPEKMAAAEKACEEAESHLEEMRKRAFLLEYGFNKHLSALTFDLEAIDNTLRQHEIQISPDAIPPIMPQKYSWRFSYGKITRGIFECLGAAEEEAKSTTELAIFVASNLDREISDKEFIALRKAVSKRLRNLCCAGKVINTNDVKNLEGRWRLPDDDGHLHPPLWKQIKPSSS